MVREGYSFGLPPLLLGLLLLIFGRSWMFAAGVAFVFLGLFVFSFFRNPERLIPGEAGIIVSPADGRVMVVKEEENNGRAGKRISIFLAIWNVHVNRAPATGTIKSIEYKPGKFFAAWDEKASFQNEQNVFTQTTEYGGIVYRQIAGWVARRVVAWKKAGDTVARGERIGLMRFGSRMDVWLPSEAEVMVRVGESVKGGTSLLARFPQTVAVRKPESDASAKARQKINEDGHPA
ncbi:MAG: phosphatidylserine decarboxylase family protein [Candidatus Acidiferrum sp.]